jgi:hypothetical protein
MDASGKSFRHDASSVVHELFCEYLLWMNWPTEKLQGTIHATLEALNDRQSSAATRPLDD